MISILYVDDEPGLLDVAKVFLEQSPDLRVDIFLSAKEALASPQFASYDAIISDYQMPGMDGIAFLKTVREQYGKIPFILFTGRGREEIVIEAINNGADFYLQKGGDVRPQFAELAHKIRQAVGRRQAELSLIESEKRLSEIIDFLPDATFAIDRNGVVIAWNRAIEEMTGVPAAAMLGRGDYEYALPFYGARRPLLIDLVFKTDEEISAYYSIISREGSAITAETDHAHPKGMTIAVLLKASPLYNRQGEPVGAIESIRNITELKRTHDELRAAYEQISASEEELREQFDILTESEKSIRENAARLTYMLGFYERAGSGEKDLLDYAVEGAGIVTGSPLGYLAFLNDDESELSMYAWSKSAMKECSIQTKPIVYRTSSTGLWGEAVRQRRAVVTNDYTAPNPWKKGYPAGHPPIIRHMNVPVIDDGRVVMVAGVANKAHEYTDNDIRQLTLLANGLWQVLCQQRTKKALRDSEVRFRAIFEKSHDALMLNEGDRLVDCNRQALDLFGYGSVAEMAIMQPFDASPAYQPDGQDSQTAAESHLRTAFATGEDRFEWVHRRRDGSTFPAEVFLSTFELGGKTYLQTSVRDISERKEAEAALRERDENYRSVVEFSPLGMHFYELLPDGELIFTGANPAADTILATDHSLLCGKRIEEVFPGLAGTDIPDQYRKVASEGGVFHNDQVLYDGETIRGAFSVQAFRIRPGIMVATFTDITERKRTEAALREKTEELDRFFTTSLDLFCIADTDGYFRRLNPEWERALGYTPADLEGHRFLDFVHPDDLPATLDAISRLKEQEEILNFTNRYRHRDGTYRWIEWRSKPVGDLIYAAARDITSRIETDRALREINDRYQSLFDAMHDCVAVYDAVDDGTDFVFLDFNHAAEMAEHVSRDKVIGQRVTAAFPGVAGFGLLEVLQRVWRTGKPEQFPLAFYKDDRIAGWRDNFIYKLPTGEIVASYRDETRRKQAEDALCASEEKYRSILKNIQDVYYRSDRHGNLVMASPSILPLLGYDTLDELIGKNIARDIWQFPERRADFLARLKKDGSVKNYDTVLKRRDGSTVTVCSSSHYYYDEDGTIAGVEGIFHDVTAVREAEQHLQLLAGLLDISPASITVHDYDGRFLYANPRTFDLHGYTKDEFMALNLHQLDVPASEKHIAERMEMLRSQGEASFDVEHFKKDGSRIPLHVALRRIRWNDADAIMSVATEICDHSLPVIPSCNGTTLCTSIVDNSFDIIYMLRPDGTITFISPSWTSTLGHSPAEVIGRSFKEFVVEDDIPSCVEFLERTLESCLVQPGHEFRVYHKDGSVHWYRTSLKPVCSPEGSVTTLVGNAVDFTAYRAAEEALRQSEARYRTVIENIQDAFLRADPSGTLVMASPSAARMLGFPAAGSMLGLPVSRFFADPSDLKALQANLETGGPVTDCEVRFVRSDGTPFWGSLNARPIHDENTKITGTDLVIHDISDHRAMEHAIREANKKLSLLNSITRHDVANQLVALQGFVQIASMMKTDPVIHDYLKKIQGVAETITRQVEFTKTYQELGIGVPLWFSIEDIVNRTPGRVPVKFSKTCRTIEVFADPMLERVFFNLFDNAARHGGNVSQITVRCEREPDGILIIVEDDGAGIPLPEKEKIFARGYGKHTGLGLFLVKEILAITGISIRETGIPGSGARFELVVPKTSCRYAR